MAGLIFGQVQMVTWKISGHDSESHHQLHPLVCPGKKGLFLASAPHLQYGNNNTDQLYWAVVGIIDVIFTNCFEHPEVAVQVLSITHVIF